MSAVAGMVIAVSRGLVYKTDIQKSFESQRVGDVHAITSRSDGSIQMDVPRAPGLGLLLERLHYENYDRKYARTHHPLDDWGPEIESRVLRYRDELIVSETLATECQTSS